MPMYLQVGAKCDTNHIWKQVNKNFSITTKSVWLFHFDIYFTVMFHEGCKSSVAGLHTITQLPVFSVCCTHAAMPKQIQPAWENVLGGLAVQTVKDVIYQPKTLQIFTSGLMSACRTRAFQSHWNHPLAGELFTALQTTFCHEDNRAGHSQCLSWSCPDAALEHLLTVPALWKPWTNPWQGGFRLLPK